MLTLHSQSLDWALQHALQIGDTDVFPIPFEYEAINHDWANVKQFLSSSDVLQWTTRPARTLLSPKAKYGFRAITQLDPLDFLVFSATVYEISADLELRRIPTQSGTVFSYRVSANQDGQLFDPNVGYRQFIERCREKLAGNTQEGFVATADISDFYSRIYHHRLENALRAATQRTSHVNAVMRCLSGWNGTETFGIPVGCAPSRLLAEITLSDVDEALLANGVDFLRLMDDSRFFAESEAAA